MSGIVAVSKLSSLRLLKLCDWRSLGWSDVRGAVRLPKADLIAVWIDQRGESAAWLWTWRSKECNPVCGQRLIVFFEVVGVDHQAAQRSGGHLIKPGHQGQGCLTVGWSDLNPVQIVAKGGLGDQLEPERVNVEGCGVAANGCRLLHTGGRAPHLQADSLTVARSSRLGRNLERDGHIARTARQSAAVSWARWRPASDKQPLGRHASLVDHHATRTTSEESNQDSLQITTTNAVTFARRWGARSQVRELLLAAFVPDTTTEETGR